MTSPLDKVTTALYDEFEHTADCDPHWCNGVCERCFDQAREFAKRLESDGLLPPNLPEPHREGNMLYFPIPDPDNWEVALGQDGWIRLYDEHGAIFIVSRPLALSVSNALRAAAQYREKQAEIWT